MATVPQSIRTSIRILQAFRSRMRPERAEERMEERIAKVIAAFEDSGARWTLIGAHAVGALTEPRATVDFDFVIEEPKLRAVLRRLEAVFGPLQLDDIGAAVRVLNLDIDLVRSTSHELFRRALTETTDAKGWPIPEPELLIALKFLSSVSPWRGASKRRRDVLDLIDIYHAVGRDELDQERMLELASHVYPGAEREFGQLLGRIDRDEPLTI